MYQKYIITVSHCAVDAGNDHRMSSKYGLLSKSTSLCILSVSVSTALFLSIVHQQRIIQSVWTPQQTGLKILRAASGTGSYFVDRYSIMMSSQFHVLAALLPVPTEQQDRVNPKPIWTRQQPPVGRPAGSQLHCREMQNFVKALCLVTFMQKVKGSRAEVKKKSSQFSLSFWRMLFTHFVNHQSSFIIQASFQYERNDLSRDPAIVPG
jgi:hypothetical protein